MLVIFVIDLEHQLVLDVIVYPGMVLALAASFFWPDISPLRAFLGLAIGLVFISAPYLIYRKGMGLGDVKLGALIGLMAGFPLVLVALFLAAVSGGVVAIGLLLFRIKGRKEAIPFAPFLTAGAMIALLWGQNILDFYLR